MGLTVKGEDGSFKILIFVSSFDREWKTFLGVPS